MGVALGDMGLMGVRLLRNFDPLVDVLSARAPMETQMGKGGEGRGVKGLFLGVLMNDLMAALPMMIDRAAIVDKTGWPLFE